MELHMQEGSERYFACSLYRQSLQKSVKASELPLNQNYLI